MIAQFVFLVLAWWIVGFQWKTYRAAWIDFKEGRPLLTRECLPIWAYSALLWVLLFVAAGEVLS
jgi:hypothetical protein